MRNQFQIVVNGLMAENLDLKTRMARTDLQHTKIEKHIKSLESTVKRIRSLLDK